MRRPDLLILIAIWQFLNALFCAIGIAAIAIFAFPATGRGDVGATFGLSIGVFFLLAFIGLSVAGGVGLLMGKNWGRIVSIVNAALNLLNIPIGTIIGVLVLIYLTKPNIREYFEGG
jgi:hypothetical protein